MTTSRLPYVIDALVTLLRATSGYRDPESTGAGIPVFDGPEYGIVGDRATTWLCVGWSGDPDAPQDGGEASQVIASLGNVHREETGSIPLRVVSQSGDRDMQARRNAAFAAMGAVEDLVRGTPQLGLDASWMREAHLSGRYSYRQEYNAGAVFTLDFPIAFRARI